MGARSLKYSLSWSNGDISEVETVPSATGRRGVSDGGLATHSSLVPGLPGPHVTPVRGTSIVTQANQEVRGRLPLRLKDGFKEKVRFSFASEKSQAMEFP